MSMKKMNHAIRIGRLGKATTGFRVLAARESPVLKMRKKFVDTWIPALAPSLPLWKNYRRKNLPWEEFNLRYLCELHSPCSQDLIKPLALLSLRKTVVLLCDCEDHLHCPTTTLAYAMEECRKNGNFVMTL